MHSPGRIQMSVKRHKSLQKFALTLLMHQFVGTLGVVLLAGMLASIAFELPNPWVHGSTRHNVYVVMTAVPYFPAQIVVAFLLGWLISDLFAHDSMLWVWVLPYIWLVYDFVRSPAVSGMTFQSRFSHFFGWGCRPENHCIDQVGVTLPLYAAIAYSIGALVARKISMTSQAMRKKISALVFAIGAVVIADEIVGFVFHFQSLVASVPRGWEWIVVPAGILDSGIGFTLIIFALKFRRLNRNFAIHDSLG
jgi:hypothetical protein